MSYGGPQSGRQGEDACEDRVNTAGDEFPRAVSRVAVAQLCESTGFESAQLSALDALSELVARHVRDVGKVARFYANLPGRTGCSVFEVVRALEEVADGPGSGAGVSDGGGSVVGSGLVGEIVRYVEAAEGVPFADSLPRFPVACRVRSRVSFARNGDALQPGKHIPNWLPALPEPHTYIQTPVWNERTSNPKEEKIEQARQRRKAERSLLNLEQRLVSADNGTVSSLNGASDGREILSTVVNMPTVSPEDGETNSLPLKGNSMEEERSSVLDAFKPVIKALADGSLDVDNGHIPTKGRPVFRFGFNKRTLDTDIYIGVRRTRMAPSWALGTDEKDDKKRRAQTIIRESMDDPQELHQL